MLLAANANVHAIAADLKAPHDILYQASGFIDFTGPVAVLLVAVLHFLHDDIAYEVVDQIKRSIPGDSYIVASHITDDHMPDQARQETRAVYERVSEPLFYRSREGFLRFFDGLDEPAVEEIGTDQGTRVLGYGAIAHKSEGES